MVKNEELVYLFRDTKVGRNKEVIFDELYKNLTKEAMKICHFYNNALLLFCKRDFFEELEQESKICLFKCIDRFDDSKNATFATFYYKCLKNHISNIYDKKFNVIVNEMVDTDILSWQKNVKNSDLEQDIDNNILHDIFKKNIDNLKFSRPIHKNIFKDYIGFNEQGYGDENFMSLSRKYGLTRMGIKKICDKYFAILKDTMRENGDIEKVQLFL